MSKAVTIGGVEYKSISEAARQLKISTDTVHKLCGTTPDSKRLYNKRSIVINGIRYESVKHAADCLGTTPIQLSKKLRRMTEKGYDTSNFDLIGYMQDTRKR